MTSIRQGDQREAGKPFDRSDWRSREHNGRALDDGALERRRWGSDSSDVGWMSNKREQIWQKCE